ncbi:hypothetical protein LINPERHAP1_LOCUS9309 [Linum perenne]
MDLRGDILMYVGGTSETIYLDKEDLCYFRVKRIGIKFFFYKLVQGIWYLEPNKSMGDGLHEIRNDSDITNGLLTSVGNDLELTLFMTGYLGLDYGADNEDGTIGSQVQPCFDSPPENLVGPEFSHLVDNDLRTTNDEFEDTLFMMGVRRTGKRVAFWIIRPGRRWSKCAGPRLVQLIRGKFDMDAEWEATMRGGLS